MSDIEPTDDEITEDEGTDDTEGSMTGKGLARSQPPREGDGDSIVRQ
jgi:hypothetical protein